MTCVHENMLRQSNWMVKWCLLSKIQCNYLLNLIDGDSMKIWSETWSSSISLCYMISYQVLINRGSWTCWIVQWLIFKWITTNLCSSKKELFKSKHQDCICDHGGYKSALLKLFWLYVFKKICCANLTEWLNCVYCQNSVQSSSELDPRGQYEEIIGNLEFIYIFLLHDFVSSLNQ